MNEHDIEQAIDGLKLQRFWPHQDDIVEDATRALAVIEELQARNEMLAKLADVTADNAAEQIEQLQQRNHALEELVETMMSKVDWEVMVDMKAANLRWRRAASQVLELLEDAQTSSRIEG